MLSSPTLKKLPVPKSKTISVAEFGLREKIGMAVMGCLRPGEDPSLAVNTRVTVGVATSKLNRQRLPNKSPA